MQRYTAWLRQVGVTAPKLAIESPVATRRRGLFAKQAIAADEFIASIPRPAILSSESAPEAARAQLAALPAFGALERSSVELALALCAARLDGSPKWAPWLAVLPKRVPGWLHVSRDEAVAMLSKHASLEPFIEAVWAEVERTRGEYQRIYEACGIRAAVSQLGRPAAAAASVAEGSNALREEEVFGWALSIVCSRGQSMDDGPEAACGMYPLLDMANCRDYDPHPDDANAKHFNLPTPSNPAERAVRDDWYRQAGVTSAEGLEEDRLLLQALRPIRAGEEIFESCYRGKSDLELFYYFGFVPDQPEGGAGRALGEEFDDARHPVIFLERQRQLNAYYADHTC